MRAEEGRGGGGDRETQAGAPSPTQTIPQAQGVSGRPLPRTPTTTKRQSRSGRPLPTDSGRAPSPVIVGADGLHHTRA